MSSPGKSKSGWWCGPFFIFPYILGIVTPTDEVIFFRGVGQPPTRNSWGVDTNPFNSHQNWVRPLLGGTSSCTNSSTAPVCCEAQEGPNGMGAPEFLPKSWLLETMVWDWCCFFWGFGHAVMVFLRVLFNVCKCRSTPVDHFLWRA